MEIKGKFTKKQNIIIIDSDGGVFFKIRKKFVKTSRREDSGGSDIK
jgi:hypothetical protein